MKGISLINNLIHGSSLLNDFLQVGHSEALVAHIYKQ